VSPGRVVIGALLVTLATPTTWLLALAAFLLRGGIVLVAVPILVLPTPVGLGNAIGPALTSVAFGTIPIELVVVVGPIGVGVLAWLVLGGWLAAAIEAEGARIVASDEDVAVMGGPLPPRPPGDRRVTERILVARLIACVPLGIALALGSVRLVFATYRELTNPLDVSTPIVVRVLRASPEVVIGVVAVWIATEIVGVVAARRIALAGAGVRGALGYALVVSVRHPLTSIARFCVPALALLLVLVPSVLAAMSAFEATGSALGQPSDPIEVLGAVVIFVALWVVGLLLMSVVCAWRSAVWTVAEVTGERTFGGSGDRQPGDWRVDRPSARL
jgi:hypothetical protein